MTSLFDKFAKLFDKKPALVAEQNITKNLTDEPIDLIFAINQASILPAVKLAKKHDSFTIIDLNHIPDPEFNSALTTANIVFCANRQLATTLEKSLNRHITLSHHIEKQPSATQHIDLKKIFHLIDTTQIIAFSAEENNRLRPNLTFLAQLLNKLPRHIHIVVTGDAEEHRVFNQHEHIFKKYDSASRLHFYTENIKSIEFPLDYSNIDLSILLPKDENQIPTQYYKYLTHQVPIFTTNFADANQLITTAKIGQVLTHQDVTQWAEQIKTTLNFSHANREIIKSYLKSQNKNINWQDEAEHYINSIINIKPNAEHELHAYIVDISTQKTSLRAHNISYMLMAQGIKVTILTQSLPQNHSLLSHNIEYIKV